MCVGALGQMDLNLGGDIWLLGDRYRVFFGIFRSSLPLNLLFISFMKNAYTIFDIEARTVGFAQLKAYC